VNFFVLTLKFTVTLTSGCSADFIYFSLKKLELVMSAPDPKIIVPDPTGSRSTTLRYSPLKGTVSRDFSVFFLSSKSSSWFH